jgi:CBS domain-containing protein
MTDRVLTVDRTESPGALTEAMVELDVKSVVVTDDACRPEGIITSTDYLRLIDDGVDPAETTVEAVMTADVVTAGHRTTVREAAALMADRGIGHLPVVDDAGVAVGMVSATDLTEHLAGDG